MGNQPSMKAGGGLYCDCIEDKKTKRLRDRQISFGAVIQKSPLLKNYIEFTDILCLTSKHNIKIAEKYVISIYDIIFPNIDIKDIIDSSDIIIADFIANIQEDEFGLILVNIIIGKLRSDLYNRAPLEDTAAISAFNRRYIHTLSLIENSTAPSKSPAPIYTGRDSSAAPIYTGRDYSAAPIYTNRDYSAAPIYTDRDSITSSKRLTHSDCQIIEQISNNNYYKKRHIFYATVAEINGPKIDRAGAISKTNQLKLLNICIELNGKIVQISDHMHLSLKKEILDCKKIRDLMFTDTYITKTEEFQENDYDYLTDSLMFYEYYNNYIVKPYKAIAAPIYAKEIITDEDREELKQNDHRLKIKFTANVFCYDEDNYGNPQKAKVINLEDLEIVSDTYWTQGDLVFRDTIFTHKKTHRGHSYHPSSLDNQIHSAAAYNITDSIIDTDVLDTSKGYESKGYDSKGYDSKGYDSDYYSRK